MWVRLLLLCGLLCLSSIGLAQTELEHQLWEVYLERDVGEDGTDRLQFLNILNGTSSSVRVFGERYTLLGNRVLYFDRRGNQVMLAAPDGSTEIHPFISLADGVRRVDWLVADDARWIVWTATYDDPAGLRTVTRMATPAGAESRLVLEDGPRNDGVRALPVAFDLPRNRLLMDAHPDGLGRFSPYTQYAGLFSVRLDDGTIELLPEEPGCYCAAAFAADQVLRLAVTDDFSGFDMRIVSLTGAVSRRIPAYTVDNYTQAGDILIAPDGSRAIYALSQIENFGALNQTISTQLVLVNLREMTQEPLGDPITTYVHPLSWTEDNTAILFTSAQRTGTWKISLEAGELQQVATASYLGTLSD